MDIDSLNAKGADSVYAAGSSGAFSTARSPFRAADRLPFEKFKAVPFSPDTSAVALVTIERNDPTAGYTGFNWRNGNLMQSAQGRTLASGATEATMHGLELKPPMRSMLHVMVVNDTLDSLSTVLLPYGFGYVPMSLGVATTPRHWESSLSHRSLAVWLRPRVGGTSCVMPLSFHYDSVLLHLRDMQLRSKLGYGPTGEFDLRLLGVHDSLDAYVSYRRPRNDFVPPAMAITLRGTDNGEGFVYLYGGCRYFRFAGRADRVAVGDRHVQVEDVDRIEASGDLQFRFTMTADQRPRLEVSGRAYSIRQNEMQLLYSLWDRNYQFLVPALGWLVALAVAVITVWLNNKSQKTLLRQRVRFDASVRVRERHASLQPVLEDLALTFYPPRLLAPRESESRKEWRSLVDDIRSLADDVGLKMGLFSLEVEGHARVFPDASSRLPQLDSAVLLLQQKAGEFAHDIEETLRQPPEQDLSEQLERLNVRMKEGIGLAEGAMKALRLAMKALLDEVYRAMA
jgi:hypothetical protein